jgi:HEAT repeat protein
MKTLFPFSRTTFVAVPALALLLMANVGLGQAASDPWQTLPKWQFGQSREPLASIEEEIRKSSPSDRQEIEGRLLEILPSPSATKDSKRFICQWLGTVGGEKSVPALAELLPDPDLSHPARIALERLAHASAGKALVDALPKVTGELLIGVISSIGTKGVEQAVPELAKLAANSDAGIARAALAALGRIGSDAAVEALSSVTVEQGLRRDLAQAQVSAGSRLAANGKDRAAIPVFERLMSAPDQTPAIKAAAFQGLAQTLPDDDRVNFLANALQSEDALLRSSAVKAFAGAGSARDTIAARLPKLQPAGQLLLVGILADAPDVAARKPLLAVAQQASDPAVKAAALECLAVHGTAEDVPFVAKSAAVGEAPVKSAAKRTLQRLSGEGVDAQFIRLLESPDAAQRAAVMEALPARRMSSALPALTRLVRGTDLSLAADAAGPLRKWETPSKSRTWRMSSPVRKAKKCAALPRKRSKASAPGRKTKTLALL